MDLVTIYIICYNNYQINPIIASNQELAKISIYNIHDDIWDCNAVIVLTR